MGTPHKEEKVIGGNIDLDLLSLSLKDMQESWEGYQGGSTGWHNFCPSSEW
jgi:hypothetical protein